MGRLEELAKDRGHNSLRAVAQTMRKSEHWPAKDKRSADTVANKLRDADKGKDVAWWISGAGRSLLPALADALQEDDEDDLIERLQNELSASMSESPAFWHFKMFPSLRAIDLRQEEPFPGVPPALLRTGGPREARTWWVAPTGAGKTLVGQWLEARHGWTYLQAESWANVELPTQGRVFVELSSIAGLSAEVFKEIPTTIKLCIACPYLQFITTVDENNDDYEQLWGHRSKPAQEQKTPLVAAFGYNILYTSPANVWAHELLEWAARRVKPGGGFNRSEVHDLLFRDQMHTLFATPGELIGFLGIVDHVGLQESESQSTDVLRWIRVWMMAALERFGHPQHLAGVADLLKKRGPEILRDIEMERLRRDLGPVLSEAQWCELVPRGYVPELNREHLLSVVEKAGPDALTQLRTLLAPDPASVIDGLKMIGGLVESVAGRWSVKPAWIANAVHNVAIGSLYADAPDGLGALLLYKNTSEHALHALINDVCNGNFRSVEACLKAGEPSSPEQMVALDGVFRAIGIALMNDISPPVEWVHKIWVWQMRHTFRHYTSWPPIPILHIAEGNRADATGISVWLFAAFSISRALTQAKIDIGRSALNPWGGLPEDATERDICIEALSSIGRIGRSDDNSAEQDPLELLAYRLGAALFEQFGMLLHRRSRLLDLQGPDVLVTLASKNQSDIPGSNSDSFLFLPFGLHALEQACQRQRANLDDVLRWCWSHWMAQGDIWRWPPFRWTERGEFGAKHKNAARIWQVARADALPITFYEQLGNAPRIWPYLHETIWARWIDIWSRQDGGSHDGAAIFQALPEALALQAVRDGRVDPWSHGVRAVLWERMPAALLELVDELAPLPQKPHPRVPDDGGPVAWLVYAAPAEHCAALVERARNWLAEPAKYPGVEGWVRRWLARVIEQRASGWREAYALIVDHA